jgi:hypothetical protein
VAALVRGSGWVQALVQKRAVNRAPDRNSNLPARSGFLNCCADSQPGTGISEQLHGKTREQSINRLPARQQAVLERLDALLAMGNAG